MKLYDAFNRQPSNITASGSQFEPVYQTKVDKNGHKSLVKTGERNVYEIIQQNAVGVDLASIIKRCTLLNDSSLLMQRNPIGDVDLTQIPGDLMAAQNAYIAIKDSFYQLPVDIRRQFDNSPDVFVASFGTDKFNSALGIKPEEPVASIEPVKEVLPDAVKT